MSLKAYVKASCHCGRNAFQAVFLTSTLPQATDMCHCNACRHSTGKLAVNAVTLSGAPLVVNSGAYTTQNPADLSTLATFNASPGLTRYFCPGCGAIMFFEFKTSEKVVWMVSTGVLDRTEGIAKVGYHAYVADTRDGGLADHCQTLDGKQLPRYAAAEGGKTISLAWKANKSANFPPSNSKECLEECLEVYCQCKNIKVHLARPTPAQAADPSQCLVLSAATDPNARVRFMAMHDVCTSCRLTGGCILASWATVPRINIIDNRTALPIIFLEGDGSQGVRMPGLTQYQSSPGTFREFCGNCGATAFVWSRKNWMDQVSESAEEPMVIKIGVGLFDEENDGARAEGWCFWAPNIANAAEALDIPTRDAVQASLDLLASSAEA